MLYTLDGRRSKRYRNKKDYKRVLWTSQNGQIPRKKQATNIDLRKIENLNIPVTITRLSL